MDTPRDEDAFYRVLARVLQLPSIQETWVFDHVREVLHSLGAVDALDWLQDTLEAESTMTVWEDRRGSARECLLFAVPLITPSQERLFAFASEKAFQGLLSVMDDAQLFEEGAKVGLVNRVLSAPDLQALSMGDLSRLRDTLCEQLLDDELTQLRMPLDWALEPPTGRSPCPDTQLHYLVGVVATDEALNALPDLSDTSGMSGPVSGHTSDGYPWDTAFSAHFCHAFNGTQVLSVGPPEGFHDGFFSGGQLARGTSLLMGLRERVNPRSKPFAVVTPLLDPDGPYGYHVDITPRGGTTPAMRMLWPVLAGETPDEALDMLGENLTQHRVAPGALFADETPALPPSYRLH